MKTVYIFPILFICWLSCAQTVLAFGIEESDVWKDDFIGTPGTAPTGFILEDVNIVYSDLNS